MEQKTIRCAVYTRKSTEEGLDKEFNTLEAQREAGENYIKSQKQQGWVLIPEHYDDGGYIQTIQFRKELPCYETKMDYSHCYFPFNQFGKNLFCPSFDEFWCDCIGYTIKQNSA